MATGVAGEILGGAGPGLHNKCLLALSGPPKKRCSYHQSGPTPPGHATEYRSVYKYIYHFVQTKNIGAIQWNIFANRNTEARVQLGQNCGFLTRKNNSKTRC